MHHYLIDTGGSLLLLNGLDVMAVVSMTHKEVIRARLCEMESYSLCFTHINSEEEGWKVEIVYGLPNT